MQVVDLEAVIEQKAFAEMVGVSPAAVSNLVKDGVLVKGQTAGEWLKGYTGRLREQAAGRAANGGLDLATERAGLAREQRLLTAVKRRRAEKEVAPVALLTLALAKVSAQLSSALDALPGKIKRACPELPASALALVEEELAKGRNLAAEITVELDDDDDDNDGDGTGDSQGDLSRAKAA